MKRTDTAKRSAARRLLVRMLCVMLTLTAVLGLLPSEASAEPVIMSYRLTDASGRTLTRLDKDGKANLEITLRETEVMHDDVGAVTNIDVLKQLDSFRFAGVPDAALTSVSGGYAEVRLTFRNIEYNGTGNTFRFLIGYKNSSPVEYTSRELSLTECKEYTEPEKPTVNIPMPTAVIDRGTMEPVAASQSFTLNISIKNTGVTAMQNTAAVFSLPDGLSLLESSSSKQIGTVRAGQTVVVPLRMQAAKDVASPMLVLGVDLRFIYDSGSAGIAQGTAEEKLMIPAVAAQKPAPPVLRIERGSIKKPVATGESMTLEFTVRNSGKAAATGLQASLSPSEGLLLDEGSSSVYLPDVAPGSLAKATVKLRGASEITSDQQSLSVELHYSYQASEGETQATASERLLIPAVVSKKQPAAAPIVTISRDAIGSAIKAKQAFTLVMWVKNNGPTAISSPIATISPSESLTLAESTSSFALPSLAPGQKAPLRVRLKAGAELASAQQSVSAELRYNYASSEGETQGTASEKLLIPCIATEKQGEKPAPALYISRADIKGAVKAGRAFPVTIFIKNLSDTTVTTPVATFTPSESLMLLENSSSRQLPDLRPGAVASVTLKARALAEIASPAQSVSVDIKFNYASGGAVTGGTAGDKVPIDAVVTKKSEPGTNPDGPVPNIILKNYSYGDTAVSAGAEFELSLDFINTSKKSATENIVMSLEPGEGVTIASSSNTFFYEKLAAGAIQSQKIKLRALPNAETGSPKLAVNFKYEYTDNGKRNAVTSAESISIPVYQPDRFEISKPETEVSAEAGSEGTISLPYNNKGKSTAANLQATLEGDDIGALASVQNLGNIEAGKSGTIDFIFKPETPGPVKVNVKVTYEDTAQAVKTLDFPIEFNVGEGIPEEPEAPFEEESEEPAGPGALLWWCVGGAVIIAGGMTAIAIRSKKKKKKAAADNWALDDEDDSDEDI